MIKDIKFAFLFRPLSVPDRDRLIFSVALREGFNPFSSSNIDYAAYRDRSHVIENSGVATQRSFNLANRDGLLARGERL